MPKGQKIQGQKELGEKTVSTTEKPDSTAKVMMSVSEPKAEKEVLRLTKKPFVKVGDEFELPEIGTVKIMDLAYPAITKVPGALTVDGKATFEDKTTRERFTGTEDIEPDFLPSVQVIYKLPPVGREPAEQKTVGLAEFYKLVEPTFE